jgi:hypothetical protein
MKLLSTIAILFLFIAAVPNNDDVPAKKGWKSLFDGKTKKGWHIFIPRDIKSSFIVFK